MCCVSWVGKGYKEVEKCYDGWGKSRKVKCKR